jgi:uridine kinase
MKHPVIFQFYSSLSIQDDVDPAVILFDSPSNVQEKEFGYKLFKESTKTVIHPNNYDVNSKIICGTIQLKPVTILIVCGILLIRKSFEKFQK